MIFLLLIIVTAALFVWLAALSGMVKETMTFRGAAYTIFGLGVLAYAFGVRHGFDADHLTTIDNSTRKLVQEGKPSLFTGMFFSLGHSTVVIALAMGLMVATRAVARSIPTLEDIGSIVGTLISGVVLYVIGLLNALVMWEIYNLYREVRAGKLSEEKLEEILLKRGFMSRFFKRLFKIVDRQEYLYPIGVLFGLGFDTASETALLAISASAAVLYAGIPLWLLLVFPFLFTAGMVLVDGSDGFFMNGAYGWAFSGHPVRKVWYNLTSTIISIILAYAVGTLELLGLIQSEFNLAGPFWNWIGAVNGESWWSSIGIIIVGIFAAVWGISFTIYKLRIERSLGEVQRPAT
jgi:high-affinity nickel-transport protein